MVDEYHPLEKCVGHWTLVHVGFGMSLINEDEAEGDIEGSEGAWRSAGGTSGDERIGGASAVKHY